MTEEQLLEENAALLDLVEELCRTYVHTNPGNRAAGDRKTVACLPVEAEALELLAANPSHQPPPIGGRLDGVVGRSESKEE